MGRLELGELECVMSTFALEAFNTVYVLDPTQIRWFSYRENRSEPRWFSYRKTRSEPELELYYKDGHRLKINHHKARDLYEALKRQFVVTGTT